MAPGRLFKITALRGSGSIAGAGVSSATIFVVVLIAIVVGYLVLEKGSEKSKTTGTSSNFNSSRSDHISRSSREESHPPPPPLDLNKPTIPSTDPLNSGSSDIPIPTPGFTDEIPPSSIPPSPNTGNSFSSLSTGLSQASSDFEMPPSPAPTDYSINTADEEAMDREKFLAGERFDGGNDMNRFVQKPPLIFWMTQYRELLYDNQSQLVRKRMEEIESLMAQDWTFLGPGGAGGQAERANDDQWTPRFGKLPRVVTELCDVILASGIIDIAKLRVAMENTPNIWESRACPFKDISETKNDMSYTLVRNGSGSIQAVDSGSEKEIASNTLLGWFALAYRGYERDQWTDQSDRLRPSEDGKREDERDATVGERAGIIRGDPGRCAGLVLPEAVANMMDERSQGVLLWLAWAGEQYLINRLFTIIGVDLLDATLRAHLLPLSSDSSEFKLDVTLFVPEASHLLKLPVLETYAHWTLMTPVGPRASPWIEDTTVRCIQRGEEWIRRNRPIEDSQAPVDSTRGRISHRRLFIRPGFSNKRVYRDPVSATGHRGPITEYFDERSPVLMQLDTSRLKLTDPLTNAKNALASLFNILRISKIHFINRRQNKWYTPQEGICTADHMQPEQLAFIFSLLSFALESWSHKDEVRDLHLDLGGFMPYMCQDEGWLGVQFELLPRVQTYFIPFMTPFEPVLHLPPFRTPGLGNTLSNLTDTMKWIVDSATGIRDSMQRQERRRPVTYVIVIKTLDSLDDLVPVHNRLHQAFFEFIDQILLDHPNRNHIDIAKEIDNFIQVIDQSVKVTSVGRCVTEVFAPEPWDLHYPAAGITLVSRSQDHKKALADGSGIPRPQDVVEKQNPAGTMDTVTEEEEPEEEYEPASSWRRPVQEDQDRLEFVINHSAKQPDPGSFDQWVQEIRRNDRRINLEQLKHAARKDRHNIHNGRRGTDTVNMQGYRAVQRRMIEKMGRVGGVKGQSTTYSQLGVQEADALEEWISEIKGANVKDLETNALKWINEGEERRGKLNVIDSQLKQRNSQTEQLSKVDAEELREQSSSIYQVGQSQAAHQSKLEEEADQVIIDRNKLAGKISRPHVKMQAMREERQAVNPSEEWLEAYEKEEVTRREDQRGVNSKTLQQHRLLDQHARYKGRAEPWRAEENLSETANKREKLRQMAIQRIDQADRKEEAERSISPIQLQIQKLYAAAGFARAKDELENWQRYYYAGPEELRQRMIAERFPWPGGKKMIEHADPRKQRNEAMAAAILEGKTSEPPWPTLQDPVTWAPRKKVRMGPKTPPVTPPADRGAGFTFPPRDTFRPKPK